MMLFISFLYLYKQHLEFRLPSGPRAGSGLRKAGSGMAKKFRSGSGIPGIGYPDPPLSHNNRTKVSNKGLDQKSQDKS